MNDFAMTEQGLDTNLLAAASGMDPQEMMRDGHALQRIGGKYSTAISVQQPRNLQATAKKLMAEAKLAGEAFFYGWGSGKDRVVGPSIGLAMAAARVWGNCAIEPQPVQETDTSWIFDCHFIDLETGFTLGRQFRQSKQWAVHGRFDTERKEDIRFQIGQSKCARNVMCNALPKWLIDAAVREAQGGVREKIEQFVKSKGIAAAVDLVIRGLGKEGVKEEAILEKCEVAERKGLTIDHVVMLRGDLYALQEGQDRAENLYPSMAKSAPEGPSTSSLDADLANGETAKRDVVPEAEKVAKAKRKPAKKPAAKKPSSPATESEPPEVPDPANEPQTEDGTEDPATVAGPQTIQEPTIHVPTSETVADQLPDGEPIDPEEYIPADNESVGTEADPGEVIEMPADFIAMLANTASPGQVTQVKQHWAGKSGEVELEVWNAMQAAMDAKLAEIRTRTRGGGR